MWEESDDKRYIQVRDEEKTKTESRIMSYRLDEWRSVRRVWRSDELALPISKISVGMVIDFITVSLTRTCVVAVVIRRSTDSRALVVVLGIVLSLQAECECQSTQCSRHTQALLRAAVLLRTHARLPCGTATIPAAAAGSSSAATVVVLFNVRLFVRVLALLAEAEDGSDGVEESAGAAEQAEEQQQEDTEDHANDDSGDGSAAEAAAAAGGYETSTCCAGGNGCLEGHGGRGCAGVGDYYIS